MYMCVYLHIPAFGVEGAADVTANSGSLINAVPFSVVMVPSVSERCLSLSRTAELLLLNAPDIPQLINITINIDQYE